MKGCLGGPQSSVGISHLSHTYAFHIVVSPEPLCLIWNETHIRGLSYRMRCNDSNLYSSFISPHHLLEKCINNTKHNRIKVVVAKEAYPSWDRLPSFSRLI